MAERVVGEMYICQAGPKRKWVSSDILNSETAVDDVGCIRVMMCDGVVCGGN